MNNSLTTNDKKVEKTLEKIQKILNKAKLNIPELLIAYGNLGYQIGAAMAGCQGTGPNLDTLRRIYYEDPTVDLGLMLQGLLITSWVNDFKEKPKLSQLAKENRQGDKK